MKKQIFNTAWYLFKSVSDKFATFGAALKAAWKLAKLKKKLNEGVAHFQFIKKDGTKRNALGLSLKAVNYTAKSNRKNIPSLLKYWDIEKQAVRSCQVWQLI